MSRSYYKYDSTELPCERTKNPIEMEIGDLYGTELSVVPVCKNLKKGKCLENGEKCYYKQEYNKHELARIFFKEIDVSNLN